MEPPKMYEIKKQLDITSLMQLVDLNGTRVNFQSDFIVSADPSQKVMVCIANQEQLDEGDLHFEPTDENGKYSRRITFQENVHLNHFIGIKKVPTDTTEQPIPCEVTVRLTELPVTPPTPTNTPNIAEKPNLIPDVDDKTKEELQKQLLSLSKSKEYINIEDANNANNKVEKPNETKNIYYKVGITCIIIFVLLIIVKYLRRK